MSKRTRNRGKVKHYVVMHSSGGTGYLRWVMYYLHKSRKNPHQQALVYGTTQQVMYQLTRQIKRYVYPKVRDDGKSGAVSDCR